ncbi:MAG TPA: hypothetical protein VK498_04515 [Ferruginibacter sp.]|nr:hypothetical protein [Ferruginibacter sp.]
MEVNENMRAIIFQVVDNQIKSNDPPETKVTFKRLLDLGYSKFEVKQLIGQCISVEMFDVMKNQKPFNEKRYVKNLQQLPKEPFDEE